MQKETLVVLCVLTKFSNDNVLFTGAKTNLDQNSKITE